MGSSTRKFHRPAHGLHQVLWLLAVFASSAFSLFHGPQAAGQSAESQRIYRSAYFLGRGDTGISTADNEDAIFYNPAGLAQGKGIYKRTILASPHVELSQATRDLARQLGAENANAVDTVRDNVGKANHVGFYNFSGLVLRRAAIGAVASSQVNLLAFKDPDSGGLEVLQADVTQNTGITFSLAESFFKGRFLVGATGKYLARGRGELDVSVANAEEVKETLKNQDEFLGLGTGTGGDVGIMWRAGGRTNPSFGLTVNDVGDTAIVPQKPTNLNLGLKQTVNVGVSVEPGTKFSKFRLLADYRDILGKAEPNPRKRTHVGVELTMRDYFGFSAGLNQGYPTGGIYLDVHFIRIDVGGYTEEAGDRAGTRPDTRYFARVRAGF